MTLACRFTLKAFMLAMGYRLGLLLFFLGLSLFCTSAFAQSKLARVIQVPAYNRVPLRELLDQLEESEGFHFSYNSNLVNLDSVVTQKAYQGPMVSYLERLFGDLFIFKETGSHLIITYAPQRMDVSVEVKVEQNRAMVTGYVRDIRTQRAIPQASVYDRVSFQSATLSNQEGYFALDVRGGDQQLALGLSKELYRDTSITLLLPIDVVKNKKGHSTGYYSSNQQDRTVYDTYFGRFFTNSSQRIQSLNLAGFFAYRAFQVSLTPGLSTHGFFNAQIVNTFSLNIIGGSTAGVEGTEIGGVFNVNQYDMHGNQIAGVINLVGGNVKGFQLAGAGNVVVNNVQGFQLGGIWNTADSLKKGMQLAGAMNRVKTAQGTQMAGLFNFSGGDVNHQLAGAFNVAKKVKGIQMAGLINIADSSDYPVALLSLVKNGRKELAFQYDESKFMSVNFRSGGRVLYSVLGFGMYTDRPILKYGAEFGLGSSLLQKPNFSLAVELVQRTHFESNFRVNDSRVVALRLMPAWSLSKNIYAFVAPSFNYTEATEGIRTSSRKEWRAWKANPEYDSFHMSATAGIFYRFK